MLKWAVNGTRQSYLQDDVHHLDLSLHQLRSSQAHKSMDMGTLRPKLSWQDKENRYTTSTPLKTHTRSFIESPLRQLDSFRDLSNIMASPKSRLLSNNSNDLLKTPKKCATVRSNVSNNIASTLSSFEGEYSPCALRPRRLHGLKAMGLLDIYFKKPRYLTKFNILINGRKS